MLDCLQADPSSTTVGSELENALLPAIEASSRGHPDTRINPYLRGTRGLLALLVFTFHIGASGTPSFRWQTQAFPHAALVSLQFSVEVFFCISGYLIVSTLNRARGPGQFFRNRAVRILPVLWMTLAILVPLGLATRQGVFSTLPWTDLPWVLPANLLPLAGALPIPILHIAAWSLSYELVFYVIAAALWWLPSRHRCARVAVVALAAGFVGCHPRAIFFAVGAMVARVDFMAHRWLRHATRMPGFTLVGFFGLWYMVLFGGTTQGGTLLDWVGDGRVGLAVAAIGLGTAAFAGLVAGQGSLCKVLRSNILQYLGTLSFSFYLWHVIVIGITKRLLSLAGATNLLGPWSQLVLAAVCLPVTIGVAALSARLIEQDLAIWLKR